MLTYFGWGVTDQNSTDPPVSDVPLEVEAPTISNEECSEIHGVYMGQNETYNGYITDNMICTLAFDKDSCQRDSGGPEIVKGSDATTDLQVGVISWGLGCATNIFPGVSARISTAYEWIRTEVCNRSAEPPSDFECQAVNETKALSSSPSANDINEEATPSPSPNVSEVTTLMESDISSCTTVAVGRNSVKMMLLLWFVW
jgi:trypsin